MKSSFKLNFWIAYRLLFSKQILFAGSAQLSFLGLILGVAALVVSMSVMSGYVETLKQAMIDTTGDLQVVKRGKLGDDWKKFSQQLKEDEPSIEHMIRFSRAEAVLAFKGQVSGVLFQGVDKENFTNVLKVQNRVKQGELVLSSEKINIGIGLSKKYNVKVGDSVYLVVPLSTPFGDTGFKRQSKSFVVSSIMDFGRNEWNERLVLGDLKDLQALTEIGDRYTGALIKIKDSNRAQEAASNLNVSLGAGYSVMSWYDVNRNMFEAVVIEKAVIFFVVLLIVIVAAFNISSTLYVFVRQKYADIAILKTLGLSPKKIRLIFLGQGLIVAALGTLIGIDLGYLFGYGFMYLQDHYSVISGSVYKIDKIYTEIKFLDVLIITLSTHVICLVAAYFPAYKGSQLEVIEGLKNG